MGGYVIDWDIVKSLGPYNQAIATALVALVAYRGLQTWRYQHSYELGRRILSRCYTTEALVEGWRKSWMAGYPNVEKLNDSLRELYALFYDGRAHFGQEFFSLLDPIIKVLTTLDEGDIATRTLREGDEGDPIALKIRNAISDIERYLAPYVRFEKNRWWRAWRNRAL